MMLGLNISQPVFEVKRRRVLLAVVLSLLGASLVYYVLTTPRGGLPHFVNRMMWKSFYGEDSCSDNGNRAALQRLLKWWLDVSTKHNIMYTLARGSLLGAVRHEDLIPRDFDLDVMLDYKYFTFLEKEAEPFPFNFNPKDGQIHLVILPKSEHSKSISNRSAYTCQGEETSWFYKDQCAFRDPLARVYEGWYWLNLFEFYDNGDVLKRLMADNVTLYSRSDLYPIKSCNFLGFKTSCPNDEDAVLSKQIGPDYFQSPYICRGGKWFDRPA